MNRPRILIVEDEVVIASDLEMQLKKMGYDVCPLASTSNEALTLANQERPDIILMDIVLPGDTDGIETAARIKAETGIPVIFLTAYADGSKIERARAIEPHGYLVKPFQCRELRAAIETALYKARMEARLKESEERYRLLVENATEAIFVIQDQQIVFINQAAGRMMSATLDDFRSRPFTSWIHPADRSRIVKEYMEELDKEGMKERFDFRFLDQRGQVRWGASSTVRILWNGRPAALNFVRDVTTRKMTEDALRESEAGYTMAQQAANMGSWHVDLKEPGVHWSQQAATLLGMTRKTLERDQTIFPSLVFPEDYKNLQNAIQTCMNSGGTSGYSTEYRIRKPEGAVRWIAETGNVVRDGTGSPVMLAGFIQDVTDRRQTEEQLLAYQEQLRRLASELAVTEARERRQIAADLHDQIGQMLFMIRIKIEALEDLAPMPEAIATIRNVSGMIENVIQAVRTMILDISPPVLQVLGLEAALEELAEKIEQDHGIRVHISGREEKLPLSDDMKDLVYRAIREVIFNAVKHAEPEKITVDCRRRGSAAVIDIRDDGIGFDVSSIPAGKSSGSGFGLFSIRERLGPIGGGLDIESRPGCGTTVTLVAPLKAE